MGSRKRPADWSAALSHERMARAEAVGERLAAEQQLEELQEQLAGVEAEREGLESQLTALGAEREAHAELERDLEDALEELQDTEELTASLQVELEALRGGESARSQAPRSSCRRMDSDCFVFLMFTSTSSCHLASAPVLQQRQCARPTASASGMARCPAEIQQS